MEQQYELRIEAVRLAIQSNSGITTDLLTTAAQFYDFITDGKPVLGSTEAIDVILKGLKDMIPEDATDGKSAWQRKVEEIQNRS